MEKIMNVAKVEHVTTDQHTGRPSPPRCRPQ
jgi:hypothetical protein